MSQPRFEPTGRRVAVIGAGPIGLEAALYGAALGHDVRVYERGAAGEHLRRWGWVRLFSPWRLNHSPLGARVLQRAGLPVPAPDDVLTGAEHAMRYLEPLAASAELAGRLHGRTAVIAVGRDGIGKGDMLDGGRERHAFRLLLEDADGERIERADVVIDASGTYGTPNWLGDGNVPAPGERALGERIRRTLPDVAGAERAAWAGARVLLAGHGYSAASALEGLRDAGASVDWVVRTAGARPYPVIAGDPLPGRLRLAELANELACGGEPQIRVHRGTVVEALAGGPGGPVEVRLRGPAGERTVTCDRVLSLVGYGPDASLYRELQIHECYATLGPMKLAAALLAAGGGEGDCLAQVSQGPDCLRNPEPDFYVIGAKSYGRNSDFLIRLGLDQVREVYTLIERRPDLDLYAAA